MLRSLLVAGACAAMVAAPACAKKNDAYAAGLEVQSTNDGSDCLEFGGDQYSGVLQYGGLSATVDTLRMTLPGRGLVWTEVLTITSGIGTTQPAGTFTWQEVKPSGTVFDVSGTFSLTVTKVDKNSYIFAITKQYGNCSASSYFTATSLDPK
jgi:hypothetical protein